MRESNVFKVYQMIQQRDSLNTAIQKYLDGKGINPKPRKVAAAKRNGHAKKADGSAKRALQGKYLGYVRHLSPSQRKLVSKTRETKGYHAAIREAKQIKAQAAE